MRILTACASLLLAGILTACGGDASGNSGAAQRGPLRFPVETLPVASARVEYSISAVGSIEAFEEVSATARVGGVVERIRFREGDQVTPERVLAEIEPERFRLAVDSARAARAKAEASRDEARLGLERRRAVNEKNPNLVRAEEVDAWRTQLAAAEADVARAGSALELAELNLRDAFVRAPVAGVVQTRDVETGRYVQPGTVIATLVRRDPLLLRFRVPETDVGPIEPGREARFTLRGARSETYTATITLVGAAADPRDRMVEITAEVDDSSRGELRPGAFAEVRVPIDAPRQAPVIPQTAIRPSDRGFLAYVVEPGEEAGDVAHERVLELGLRTEDGQVEILSGLAIGERLVVRGAEALSDGAPVQVVERPAS